MRQMETLSPAGPAERLVERVEHTGSMDDALARIRQAVLAVLPPGRLADLLHGTWLGHPLHPVLTDVPIGAWASAGILDAVPGMEKAATTLVGVGLAAAVPTAVAGAADWSEASTRQQRLGLVHAAANAAGTLLFAGSLAARLLGRHRRGRTLGWLGLAALGVGGYLGGHLSYRSGTGMNQGAPSRQRLPEDWTDLDRLEALPDDALTRRTLGDAPVVVYRDGDRVRVLVEMCSHLGGPLSQGEVDRDGAGEPCVICPWHGSTFRLRDGAVRRGPAASAQPVLDVRVIDGVVQARRPD